MYSFSTYDMAFKAAKCYMCHEGLAKRGPNEIASFDYDSGSQPVGNGPLVGDRAFCAGPQSYLKNWLFGSKKYFCAKTRAFQRDDLLFLLFIWRSSEKWQKIADCDAITFFFGDRLKVRRNLRERAMENFQNDNRSRLQKG